MTRWSLVLVFALTGCAYMTKDEFLDAWDQDGDGWPVGEDCNDDPDADGATVFPYAADVRGDGCDADCGMTLDSDGDDWPDDSDCGPSDAHVYPCSVHEVPGDGIDSDCDGHDEARADVCAGLDPDFAPEEQAPIDLATCGCPSPANGGCGA